MKMRFNYKYLLFLFCLIGIIQSAEATRREYTKTIENAFPLSQNGTVNIENMHGDVDIDTWAKDEVEIRVVITVMASKDKRAEEVFDRIDIDFTSSDNYVGVETEIDSKKSFWWFIKSWWGDSDVEIDYEVFMPEGAKLDLENKYGDVDIEDIFGELRINVKHGDVKVDHAASKLDLDLGYGNGVIAKANEVSADLAYFKLRINDANTIDINSKFSRLTVESVNELISDSNYDGYYLGDVGVFKNEGKYDKIKIDQAEDVDINTKYTDVEIDKIFLKMDCELHHGGLVVDEVSATFEEITIESDYAGIDINLEKAGPYRIDVQTEHTSVRLPDDIEYINDQKEDQRHIFDGYRGDRNAKGSIYIRAEYGGLKVR